MGKKITYWIPAIIWAGLIFFLSAQPSLGLGTRFDAILRNLAHFLLFFVLNLFIYYGFKSGQKKLLTTEKLRFLGFALVLSFLYALSDEFHQYFVPGRSSSIWDILVDSLGIFTSFVLMKKAA